MKNHGSPDEKSPFASFIAEPERRRASRKLMQVRLLRRTYDISNNSDTVKQMRGSGPTARNITISLRFERLGSFWLAPSGPNQLDSPFIFNDPSD